MLASERVAAQRQAVMERLEFQLNEYAQLEAAIRAGFARVEENVGAAVTHILMPFLAREAVKYVADELCRKWVSPSLPLRDVVRLSGGYHSTPGRWT